MKKNKRIIAIVLAIMLTVSVGYALFSQTINITGTAKAQGDFQITATCNVGLDNNISTAFNWHWTKNSETPPADIPSSVNSSSCTVDGNNVTFSADLKYPGAKRLFTIKFKNTGTVDAYIPIRGGVTKTNISTRLCFNGTNCTSFYGSPGDRTNSAIVYDGWHTTDIDTDYIYIAEKNDETVVYGTDPDLENFAVRDGNNNLIGFVIRPGEAFYGVGELAFRGYLEGQIKSRQSDTYSFTTSLSLTYNFEQYEN